MIRKKQKQYKRLIGLFFFLLAIIYADIGYAKDLVNIIQIDYFSRIEDGVATIKDRRDGRFELAFTRQKMADKIPGDATFDIIGANGMTIFGKVDKDKILDDDFNAINEGDLHSCFIAAEFKEQENSGYLKFIAKFLDQNNEDMEIKEGSMPELRVDVKASGIANTKDVLILENIHSETIKIVNVQSGDKRLSVDAGNCTVLSPKGRCEIKLKLDQDNYLSDKKAMEFSDTVEIKYEIERVDEDVESITGIVSIKSHRIKQCEQRKCPAKQFQEPLATTPLVLKRGPSQSDLKLPNETSVTLSYTIKNTSDKLASLQIEGIKQPIYRSFSMDSGAVNCGDSLDAGKSCSLKFEVYPTKIEDVKQMLKVSSDALSESLSDEIEITVTENSSRLQITPKSQSDEVRGSVQNLVCSDSSNSRQYMVNIPVSDEVTDFNEACKTIGSNELKLKYLLENTSERVLEIVSIKVPDYRFGDNPAFKVEGKNKNLKLQPGEKREMSIIFNLEKAKAKFGMDGNTKGYLEVGIKNGKDNPEIIEIPILINKVVSV